ncbi:MAG TPA: peptidylprolyl isomerase [Gemmatimonadales bacterium]|nr:peptidylprolyl isomerase [Gemmatimonadales bacterium]
MRRSRAGVLLLLGAAALTARRAAAQAVGRVPVDRIVAVVGYRPILGSQVEEEVISRAQAAGQQVPTDSAARATLEHTVLADMINTELLVQEAERDTTIKVTEQEVNDAVEQTAQNVKRQFPSDQEFLRQLRLAQFGSAEEWRRWLTENQRRELLRDRLLEQMRNKGQLKAIPPTDAELRAFWEQNRGRAGKRPATVSFRQVVILAEPDSQTKAQARQIAESLATALRHGGDFASAARRFSADSGSREQGGDLGWVRRGVMVRPFEEAVFKLRPGEISPVTETEFGYHVIEVERVQAGEVLARHILIQPHVSPAQLELAHHRADTAYAQLMAGVPFDTVSRRFGDSTAQRLAEATPVASLSPEYQRLFAADTTLGLKPPIAVPGARPQFAIVLATARSSEGDLTFEDVKEQIRQKLSQDLAVQRFVDQLRSKTYIDIRW